MDSVLQIHYHHSKMKNIRKRAFFKNRIQWMVKVLQVGIRNNTQEVNAIFRPSPPRSH